MSHSASLPPLSELPGFVPLPSDLALLTDEQMAAIFGGDVDVVLRDIVRSVRQPKPSIVQTELLKAG